MSNTASILIQHTVLKMAIQRGIAMRLEILICIYNSWPSTRMYHTQFEFVNIVVRPSRQCCSFKKIKNIKLFQFVYHGLEHFSVLT